MSNIVSIIRSAIETGSYDLSSMLETIAYHQAHGDMTLEEMEELTGKARENARTQFDLEEEIVKLWQAVYALQDKLPETAVEEYPPYDPSRLYMSGDKVTFEGVKYVCAVKEGKATKFSPADKPKDWEQVEV